MTNLNIHFLTSGNQFLCNKLNDNNLENLCKHEEWCVKTAKNIKSANFLAIFGQVKKYKLLKKL